MRDVRDRREEDERICVVSGDRKRRMKENLDASSNASIGCWSLLGAGVAFCGPVS